MSKRSGFIAIVGCPNVGKSTLLNYLVGEKLAGVSAKPQTTRGVIRGILSRPEGQLVFLDTPGFHKPQDKLGHWMLGEISNSINGADLIYWMVLPGKIDPIESRILDLIKKSTLPVILLVNQVDRCKKEDILLAIDHYQSLFEFKDFIPISAKTGLQTDIVVHRSFDLLPECENLFPDDIISDQNERDIVAELIREKLYHFMRHEIPYASSVIIESFEDRKDKITEIHACFVVERDSQKGIIIGKNGQAIKEIGIEARLDIEQFLGRKVFLKLWVKTLGDWKSNPKSLKQLGYE